jgi:rod shape-determining protein MreD
MNIKSIFYFFNKFSNNILYFFLLFFLINIEISFGFFLMFDHSTPSLLSIAIYLCLRKFSIHLSSFSLFILGLLYDVLLGSNIGISSMFFLLIKYFTEYLKLSFIDNNSNDDWISFTFVFISSFVITFLLNIIVNLTIPDFSPVLFHLGATLIIFPFLVFSINFIYYINKLIKN